ncbi:hypothetical protein D3C71_1075650 [compost metagenome]
MKPGSIRALRVAGDLESGAPTLLDLRYGAAEDWSLKAIFSYGDSLVTVAVDRPEAFRVTDESDLVLGHAQTAGWTLGIRLRT